MVEAVGGEAEEVEVVEGVEVAEVVRRLIH
jgi:hypothetical protein